MKKIIKISTSLLFASLMVACNGYLEKKPRASLTPDKVFGDSTGVISTLASAYRVMHRFEYYGRDIMLMGDVLADNAQIAANTGRYTTHINNQIFSHYGYWGGAPYEAINLANFVIEESANPTVRMSEPLRNRLRAEALFIRALCHHDLLRAYSYEPANTSGFNLGVILRKKPTRGVSDAEGQARATVQESYDFVIADLQEAISLFAALGTNVSFPTRANKAAAEALLARVYLYAGKFAEAADMADIALNTVDNQAAPKAVLTTAANHRAAFNETPHRESIFELDIDPADWSSVDGVNNSCSSWTRSTSSSVTPPGPGPVYAIAASNTLSNAFPAGDSRRFGANSVWAPAGGFLECLKWRGEKGLYVENIPVIRYAEVVLILAEGRARSGNDAAALTAVNRIRTNRGLAPSTATGTALIDEIMLQRRLELAFEGHRFFDLKRLGLPIAKDPAQGSALAASDPRVLSFIPTTEVTLNPKLVQNPGY
jgi:tetratricopeptide (TPR) repeat protein